MYKRQVATPVADGFVCSIFQCHVAGSDRADFGSQHFHLFYIDMLAFYIGLAPVSYTHLAATQQERRFSPIGLQDIPVEGFAGAAISGTCLLYTSRCV